MVLYGVFAQNGHLYGKYGLYGKIWSCGHPVYVKVHIDLSIFHSQENSSKNFSHSSDFYIFNLKGGFGQIASRFFF